MKELWFFSQRVCLGPVTFPGRGQTGEQRGLSSLISPALHLLLKHNRVSRRRGSAVKRGGLPRGLSEPPHPTPPPGGARLLPPLLLEPDQRPGSRGKANSRINCNRST